MTSFPNSNNVVKAVAVQVCLALCLLPQPALQITRQDFFSYGEGDSFLPPELEEISSQEIALKIPYIYYGTSHRSIFVNSNGILSFDTEIPNFYNFQLPLNFPVIAVLYSDVDTRSRGKVYYRETQSQDILGELTDRVRRYFSVGQAFKAASAFVVTWEDVGYYNNKSDKVNTFQVALVSSGEATYAVLQYPQDGIQWIQSQGRIANLPDAKAQVGFSPGDSRIFTLHGSGTDHVRNLDKLSNIGVPGTWVYRIGKLEDNENVGHPDQNLGISATNEFHTCAQGYALCHTEARCVDYSEGFCCECQQGTYGNGQNCLAQDEPKRFNGKVNGLLNGIELQDIDLHSYVVVADGRQYTAMSKVPEVVGYDMQALVNIGGVLGWLFAVRSGKAKNGFQVTGGVFNTSTELEFPQTGHAVQVKQQFSGMDAFGNFQVDIEIKGTIPVVPSGSQLQMNDYFEEYNRVLPGMIRTQSTKSFHLDKNPSNLETPFKVDQVIMFDECPHEPRDAELDRARLSVTRTFYTYDSREMIVRYITTNKVATLGGEDPCAEGRNTCGLNSSCIVEGDTFRCICNPGYEFYYPDDSGADPTCIDINECATGRDNCHTFAQCTNRVGSFQCACLAGYSGDGTQCQKVLTCDDLNCGENAVCVTTGPLQAIECQCLPGYRFGRERNCVPEPTPGPPGLDCSVDNRCDINAECVYEQSILQYACVCLSGFRGDGFTCTATEGEVSCNIINNCHPHGHCYYESDPGIYSCRCNSAYEGDGYTCNPIDVSCDVVNICSIHAKCVLDSSQGKYVCACEEGYDGDGRTCNPADECDGAETCGPNSQCTYDEGSRRYRCVCVEGYVKSAPGNQCVPDPSAGSCDVLNNCGPHAKCVLNQDSQRHECQCEPGYSGNGFECQRAVVSCDVVFNCDPNADCVQEPNTLVYHCQCREGYVGDGSNCVSGRQCSPDHQSACDANADCVRLANFNQFVCQCRPGYTGDGSSCSETPKFEGSFLIASQGMSIVRMPLRASRGDLGRPVVLQPLQTAIGVDVDCHAGHVYWSDVSGKAIKRSNYNGSNVEVFVTDDVESPEGVTVDWISRNVFWTDSLRDTIEVARLDGPNRERKVLVETDLVNPRGLANHPFRGLLFWTDWNRDGPKIESANMDGSARTVLINNNLELPNSLTIDFEREELCWADAGVKRIECCDFYGQGRRTIISAISYPFGLTNNREHFYWTDWETRKIEIVSKVGGQLQAPLEPPLGGSGKLYGVVAVPERCPRGTNPCFTQNGGCRHLCLPSGYAGRTCACPDYTEEDEPPICNEI